MDLNTAIEEAVVALNLFLNNKFSEARQRVEPWWVPSNKHDTCQQPVPTMCALQ